MRFIPLCLLLLGAASHGVQAQHVHSGMSVHMAKRLSDSWLLSGSVALGAGFSQPEYLGSRTVANVTFRLTDKVALSGAGTFAWASYVGLPNTDMVVGGIEALTWRLPQGIATGIFFEQRRLIFRPSDYHVSATRASAHFSFTRPVAETQLSYWIGAQVYLNMRSEMRSYGFLQRVWLQGGIRRRIAGSVSLGLNYAYLFGGQDQFYFADRHNLHRLTLVLGLDFSNR